MWRDDFLSVPASTSAALASSSLASGSRATQSSPASKEHAMIHTSYLGGLVTIEKHGPCFFTKIGPKIVIRIEDNEERAVSDADEIVRLILSAPKDEV
jgi:hypothetical protein